jgi:hypothetical protein
MKDHLLAALFVTLFPMLAFATEIKVPADQPTIQDAINASASGDTITVAPGTYQQTLDFVGKDILLRSSGGNSVTTLEPTPPGGWNATVISLLSGEGPGAVIEGFTFTNAGPVIVINGASPTIRDNVFSQTWLIDIDVTNGDPIITRNAFVLGQSDVMAVQLWDSNSEISFNSFREHPRGAVFINSFSAPRIHHNMIKDCGNYNQWAPAIWMYTDPSVTPVVDHNFFLRNHGSALEVGGAGGEVNATITDNRFYDNDYAPHASILNSGSNTGSITFERNYCRGPGGLPAYVNLMIRAEYGGLVLRNDVFSRVHDDSYLWTSVIQTYQGPLALENCTFEEVEVATTRNNANDAYMIDSIVWNWLIVVLGQYVAGPTFDYSDIGPGLGNTFGPDNFSLDPMFVNLAEGDYHLLAGSPCIDAPSGGTSALIDLDGNVRDSIPDIGAYEYIGHDHWFRGMGEMTSAMTIVVQGQPGESVLFGYSPNLRTSPRSTPYGDLWLNMPITRINLGTIGGNGILEVNFSAPAYEVPNLFYTQVLVGTTITPVQELMLGG